VQCFLQLRLEASEVKNSELLTVQKRAATQWQDVDH